MIAAFSRSVAFDAAEAVDTWVVAANDVPAVVRLARHNSDATVKVEALGALRLLLLRTSELSAAARATYGKWLAQLLPLAEAKHPQAVRHAALGVGQRAVSRVECTPETVSGEGRRQ